MPCDFFDQTLQEIFPGLCGKIYGIINAFKILFKQEINDYCKRTSPQPPNDELQQSKNLTNVIRSFHIFYTKKIYLTAPIYQLPNNLQPTAYEINYNFYLNTNDEPDYFSCDETIYFTCQLPTDTIVMHMKDLTIDNSSFVLTLLNDSNPYSANQIRTSVTWSYDTDKQVMMLKFGQYVFARNTSYSLRLVFRANFRNDGSGLFKSSYINQQKSTR